MERLILRVGGRRVPQVRIGPRGARRGDGTDLLRDDPWPGRAGFEQRAAAWFARVRRRQHFDLRPWFEAGRQALENQDVRTRLEDLERSLHTRLSRLRRIASALGNLPAHNPRFVGRETEMRVLHEAAGLGQLGVISAVYGIGGLGKTALAIQYAFAYADFYPGGPLAIDGAVSPEGGWSA